MGLIDKALEFYFNARGYVKRNGLIKMIDSVRNDIESKTGDFTDQEEELLEYLRQWHDSLHPRNSI